MIKRERVLRPQRRSIPARVTLRERADDGLLGVLGLVRLSSTYYYASAFKFIFSFVLSKLKQSCARCRSMLSSSVGSIVQ